MITSSQVPLSTQHTTNIIDELPSAEIEPTIPAIEGPQTHALDCTATGIGKEHHYRDQTVSQRTAEPLTQVTHTSVKYDGLLGKRGIRDSRRQRKSLQIHMQ
jgi:hypothetical protein